MHNVIRNRKKTLTNKFTCKFRGLYSLRNNFYQLWTLEIQLSTMIWQEDWEEDVLPPVTPHGFHTNPCTQLQAASLCLSVQRNFPSVFPNM